MMIAKNSRAAAKWKPYPASKDSGVEWLGEIPAHWEVKRLRYVSSVNPNKADLAGLPGSMEVTFLPMEAIGEDGTINLDQTRRLEQVRQGYTNFRDGDVVVAKITPCFENGKGALCANLLGGVGFGTTELQVLRPSENVYSPFIFYLTKSHPFRNLGIASMQGSAGQQRVTDAFVKDFRLSLPPLPEQRAIAAFLDRETQKIDALVTKKERLIELLQEKRAALITQAVTKGLPSTDSGQATPTVPMKDSGVEWLGQIPAHWEVKRLRFVSESNPLPREVRGLPGDTEVSFVPMEAIREYGGLALEVTKQLADVKAGYTYFRDGDIVLAKITPCFENGKGARAVGLTNGIAFGTTELHVLRAFDRLDSKYLFYVTLSDAFRRLGEAEMYGAGGQKRVPEAFVKNLKHPLPPEPEQRAIAAFLDRETAKLDALVAKVREGIEKLKEYRTALISAAVTGKIDVRDETGKNYAIKH